MTYQDATLIFTGIVAISTVFYVVFTYKLVNETRLSREFFLESHIIAYLKNSETTPSLVSLIIKNIGKGLAKNVTFEVTKFIDYEYALPLSEIGIFSDGVKYFPPNHQFKYILIDMRADYTKLINDEIVFKVKYEDGVNKNRKQRFTLKFGEMAGLSKQTPPETYIGMISYRLEKIEKILAGK